METYREQDGHIIREYALEQESLVRKQTEKALIEIVNTKAFGAALFVDNQLQLTFRDEYIYHEMLVHPCLSSSQSRKRICILGGGDGCALREVLKWPDVEHIDVLDWDKEMIELFSKSYAFQNMWSFENPKVTVEIKDVRACLGESRTYDCILVDLLDPEESQSDLWQDILRIVKSWILPGGSIGFNTGGITPWQTDTLNWLLQHIESSPLFRRHLYKTFVPSFAREWCFLLLNKANILEMKNLPSNLRYLDDMAWKQAYTYGWTKNYLENLHGI
jgi:spermidine synthase